MFSALTQGSPVYILERDKDLKYNVGEIVSFTIPQFAVDGTGQMVMNVKVKVGDAVTDFNNLPSTSSISTYNNGKTIIAETKQQIQAKVEDILSKNKSILENIDSIKKECDEAENVLKSLDSSYAKDKIRDEEMASIKDKVFNMESKLDKIFEIVVNNKTEQI